MKRCLLFILLCISTSTFTAAPKVFKEVLPNGLAMLVVPVKSTQKVAVQVWYNVGSKHEDTHEKGLAHLLEHMVFKGTKNLTESDIDSVTHKVSGTLNAATRYDSTMYRFEFPVQYWREALPILADCMSNCTFKQDLLNSEFKAVIQELKMGRDEFIRALIYKMVSTIFEDHPYHYPLIGYKEDIWNINQAGLLAFYKKHYVPNNAVLVVVGDVDPQEVFALGRKNFGSIKKDDAYKVKEFRHTKDVSTTSVTLYRDVQLPRLALAFEIPGIKNKVGYYTDVLHSLLTRDKDSRLVKKLVDNDKSANWVSSFSLELVDHDLFFIFCEPTDEKNVDTIEATITQELEDLAINGPQGEELSVAAKRVQMDMYSLMESNLGQAGLLGQYYLATNDENYIFDFTIQDQLALSNGLKNFVASYMRCGKAHTGLILPMNDVQKQEWNALQQQSDIEDNQFLSQRVRVSDIEKINYAKIVDVKAPCLSSVPAPQVITLNNDIQVLSHDRATIPQISIMLELQAGTEYEPDHLPGLYNILCYMLKEGTEHYSGIELAQKLASHGIVLNIAPGVISMKLLKSDLETGLELLREILSAPLFQEEALEKIKTWALSDYKNFMDSPSSIMWKIANEHVFKGHPYGKLSLANEEVIAKVTRQDLIDFHKKVITSDKARIAMVGDLEGVDVEAVLNKTLGSWQGEKLEPITYPSLDNIKSQEIVYPMNRDQVVLGYVGLSIPWTHPDYDKLILFDQIFSGGLHSRLYKLREKHGIFYGISSSMALGADEQPGVVRINTLVSRDRLAEAEQLITHAMQTVPDTITQQELDDAKNMLIHYISDAYSTNDSIASIFLFLARFNLPYTYLVDRVEKLKDITLDEVKIAVKKVLNKDTMMTIKVGRV